MSGCVSPRVTRQVLAVGGGRPCEAGGSAATWTLTCPSFALRRMSRLLTNSPGSRPPPQRPPSRDQILCEFVQSQGIISYGSLRFTDQHTARPRRRRRWRRKTLQPQSRRRRRRRLSPGLALRLQRLLRARRPHHRRCQLRVRACASQGSSFVGSSWGVCSIGKSLDWTWKSDGACPANEAGDDDNDADTEPTGDDEQQQHPPNSAKQPPPRAAATAADDAPPTRGDEGEREWEQQGEQQQEQQEQQQARVPRRWQCDRSVRHPIRGTSFPSSTLVDWPRM
jgi:hypothetical protein